MDTKKGKKSLRINIVLPFFSAYAGGGIKVMYEYAKQLSFKGHDVIIYHSTKTIYTSYESKSHSAVLMKFYKRLLTGKYKRYERPGWFDIPENVLCVRIPYIADKYIRDADITLSTWWATAYELMKLNPSKGGRFNLIQAYETIMTKHAPELVHDTYKLPIHHIVISDYLYNIATTHNKKDKIYYVPNAIDMSVYRVVTPVEERSPYSIIMRYSTQKEKACHYALEAFIVLKEKYPALEVTFFSSEKKEPHIPDWINYIFGRSDTMPLYNNASIFVSSSIDEGWPLPPMEAMACGCACVCTNIPPHLSYMVDKENCLLVEAGDIQGIVDKASLLIDNKDMRMKLSKGGQKTMELYDWEESAKKLEGIFYEVIRK